MADSRLNLLLFTCLSLSFPPLRYPSPFAAAHESPDGGLEYPTIVEVDLVFPQHKVTYKRTADMPIVFAFQNFTAVNNFSYFFQWHLSDVKRKKTRSGTLDHNIFNATDNAGVPEPFLLVNSTGDALLDRNTASLWFLSYEFGYTASCNATDSGELLGTVGPPITLLEGLMVFSVADNGTEPDLAAAGPCAGALGNFDVLGHVNATAAGGFECPVLAEDASTTVTYGTLDKPEDDYQEEDIDPVNPCGVRVDENMAKQVSDILLKARCAETNNHTGECASAAVRVHGGTSATVSALLMGAAVGAGVWVSL